MFSKLITQWRRANVSHKRTHALNLTIICVHFNASTKRNIGSNDTQAGSPLPYQCPFTNGSTDSSKTGKTVVGEKIQLKTIVTIESIVVNTENLIE